MSHKILIAYASKCGATGEVARAIGQVWADQGEHVDVKPVSEVASLDGYAAAAIGSAIRFGQWLPEAVEFVKKNQQALNQVPVAVFTVHIMNMGDDEQSLANRKAYLTAVRQLIKPVDEVYFCGKVDPAQLSFVERAIGRMVKSPDGDFRDWDKIRGWAQKTSLV